MTNFSPIEMADASQCIISPFPRTTHLAQPYLVYIKVYTQTGEAKSEGGDLIEIETVRGACTTSICDIGTGVYHCTIIPWLQGTLDLRITINGERIGAIYHTQVLAMPKKWWRCCCR